MKIKSWMEVDGVENVSYRFQCAGICVGVRKKETNFLIAEVNTSEVSKMVVIDFLKLFGFDIEFEEPPKLSKREYHYVNYAYDDAWIARQKSNILYVFSEKPRLTKRDNWDACVIDCLYSELFPFITPDKEWSVKELRNLEVEDEY